MTQSLPGNPLAAQPPLAEPRLDLVVPFTTPRLTQDALDAANRLGVNLNARIRIVRTVVVPFPLNLNEPPIPADFLLDQLQRFRSDIAADCEVRLARDSNAGLIGGLKPGSVVILATRKRLWKTCTERLARAIRREGHSVVMVEARQEN